MKPRILRLAGHLLALVIGASLLAAATQVPLQRDRPAAAEQDQSRYLVTLCEAARDFNTAAIAFLQAPQPAPAPAPGAPSVNLRDFTEGMHRYRDAYITQYNAAAQRAGAAAMAKLHLPDHIGPAALSQCPPPADK